MNGVEKEGKKLMEELKEKLDGKRVTESESLALRG